MRNGLHWVSVLLLFVGCERSTPPESESLPVEPVVQETSTAFEGKVRFLGRVREVSEIPASFSGLEYPDALAAYVVEPLLPLPWQLEPEPVVLFAQVMADHQPTESTEIANLQGVSVDIVTAANAPEALRTMQRFDTLNFLSSEVFYAVDFEPRGLPAGETVPASILEGREAMDRLDRSGRDEILASEPSKREAIAAEKRAIVEAKARYGDGEWSVWYERLLPFRQDIQASDNHQWATGPEVTAAVSLPSFLEGLEAGATVAEEVVALANQTGQLGVDFIYVAAPVKVEIYPEKFSHRLPEGIDRVNPAKTELLAHFTDLGIEVLDLEPLFLKHRKEHPEDLLFMPGKDPHFSPIAAEIAGRAIAERLRSRSYVSSIIDQVTFEIVEEPHDWGSGWGWKETTPVIANRVKNSETGLFYESDPASPVAICGDSHVIWWQQRMTENAGLAAHASRFLGSPVLIESTRGGLPHELDRLSLDWYRDRKCVVLVQTTHLIHNLAYPLRKIRFPKP